MVAKAKGKRTPAAKRAKASVKPAARSPRTAKRARVAAPPLAAVLEAARAAASRNALAEALALLLDAWRAVPAIEIATAIERVGALAQGDARAPTGKTAAERNAAWAKAARHGDPVARGPLLDALTETKGSAETLERIELIVAHRDPRVATRLVKLVETPIYNASVSRTARFWKRLFELLPALGDPRILAWARAFEAAWAANSELNAAERPELAKRLAHVVPALEAAYGDGPPQLAPDEAARCAAIIAALRPPAADAGGRTGEELLAEIYAAPDDDHVRMIYADWLQQRSDPRGELVALQLARARGDKLTREHARREKDLLAEHLKQWLEPFGKTVNKTGARFERGFLVACRATAFGEEPAWSTVREVDGCAPASERCHVASLRVVSGLRNDHVADLARLARPHAIDTLVWDGPQYYSVDSFSEDGLAAIDAFTHSTALPMLRRLELHGSRSWIQDRIPSSALAWAWRSKPTLEELALPIDFAELPGWIAVLAATRLRQVELHGAGEADWNTDWVWRLERDGDGTLSRLTLRAPRGTPNPHQLQSWSRIVDAVEALGPTTLKSAQVAIPAEAWKLVSERLGAPLTAAFARQSRIEAPVVIEPGR